MQLSSYKATVLWTQSFPRARPRYRPFPTRVRVLPHEREDIDYDHKIHVDAVKENR